MCVLYPSVRRSVSFVPSVVFFPFVASTLLSRLGQALSRQTKQVQIEEDGQTSAPPSEEGLRQVNTKEYLVLNIYMYHICNDIPDLHVRICSTYLVDYRYHTIVNVQTGIHTNTNVNASILVASALFCTCATSKCSIDTYRSRVSTALFYTSLHKYGPPSMCFITSRLLSRVCSPLLVR